MSESASDACGMSVKCMESQKNKQDLGDKMSNVGPKMSQKTKQDSNFKN